MVVAFVPEKIRGSAFGLFATVQAVENIAATVVAGLRRRTARKTITTLCSWLIAVHG
ncbi:hypothetical protein [Parafrankia discariae]|uniref:hypothetical protein n=1 Tax=Parafrankia discariae TaxID=365528 RepID=UPI0012B67FC1|nr:hypothetical protein [Parafrankia discariae]